VISRVFSVSKRQHLPRTLFAKTLGCDPSKAVGFIDIATWEKCREWCEAEYKKCVKEAHEVFGQ